MSTRREFITLLGGAAVSWPIAARAQQSERMRRIGSLRNLRADDPEAQARNAAFLQELAQRGWIVGRNVQIDSRWSAGDNERLRKHAAELIALAPDVIVASSSQAVAALLQATRAIPIVFESIADPIGASFVESLGQPGGNATGFMNFEYSISGKWLELLKEIAPRITRVAVLRDAAIAAGSGQLGAIQSAATQLGVELRPVGMRDAGEIERGLAAFASASNGGLIVTASPLGGIHRDLTITLAARHKLPAVSSNRTFATGGRTFATGGGLMSYGPDRADQSRRAASYVDRILKGEKPADLPVQAPTKYETVLNLKTAKALGLDVPPSLLARADEVIE
jgi:putative ABC transport system substrate-binding protein